MKKRFNIGLFFLAAALSFYAGSKPPQPTRPTFAFDSWLIDNGSFATNGSVFIAARKATLIQEAYIDDMDVLVFAREMSSTNAADWVELLPRRTFGDLPAEYAHANATNYNYAVYLDYVPPSPVHTNGVWQMRGFEVPGIPDTYAFPRTRQELSPTDQQ